MQKSIAASCGKWSNTEKIERSSENCCDRLEVACSRQLAMRVPPVSLSPWDRIFHEDMQIHFIVPLSGVTGSLARVASECPQLWQFVFLLKRQADRERISEYKLFIGYLMELLTHDCFFKTMPSLLQ